MTEAQPWLGICHLFREAGGPRETFTATAAVWCADRDAFDAILSKHLEPQGLQLMWSEDVLTAGPWVQRHAAHSAALGLARAVHARHLVELGILTEAKGETGSDALAEAAPKSALIIEEILNVEPLDAQFGVWPKKTVPDALYEPLFGQPDPTEAEIAQYGSAEAVPPMKTYAILDAAKVPLLPEMLEESGLAYRCLFKGDAYEELKTVAPYVVELTEDNDLTRHLFTKSGMPADLWDKEPGIFVRSRGTLEDMWRHFRKFTKFRDDTGKWFFFRFWDISAHEATVEELASCEQSSQFLAATDPVTFILTGEGRTRRIYCNEVTESMQEPQVFMKKVSRRLKNKKIESDLEIIAAETLADNYTINQLRSLVQNLRKWLEAGMINRHQLTEMAEIERDSSFRFLDTAEAWNLLTQREPDYGTFVALIDLARKMGVK